jgi:hypothetical protein
MNKLIRICLIGTTLGISVLSIAGCATAGGEAMHRKSSNYVEIQPREYNLETREFDRPWPFGPEGGAQ